MEIDPPITDLSGGDLTDSEYADIDDGGAMLVDDSEDERDQVSRLYPSGHVFGPLLPPFCSKFTHYSKSLCKKTHKNIS